MIIMIKNNLIIRYKKFKTASCGSDTLTVVKRLLRSVQQLQLRWPRRRQPRRPTHPVQWDAHLPRLHRRRKQTNECFSMEAPLSMRLFKRASMRDTLTSVVCSELEFISPSTVAKAISTCMEFAVVLAVPSTKIAVATFVTG